MSSVCILLLTYNRLEYAKTTLRSALENIRGSYDVYVHVASDGDTNEYMKELFDIAFSFESQIMGVTRSNSERSGYGANYNLATQVIHDFADYVLVLEDDWELTRELDLDVFIGALDELGAGCMRLGYLGFTQPLRGELAASYGRTWLRLDPSSAEPHIFAGHPRIETVAWQRSVGPWPEGLEPGFTEFVVAHIAESRHGVIWPMQEVKPYGDMFVHIGAERSW
jgi:hypothetical protein